MQTKTIRQKDNYDLTGLGSHWRKWMLSTFNSKLFNNMKWKTQMSTMLPVCGTRRVVCVRLERKIGSGTSLWWKSSRCRTNCRILRFRSVRKQHFIGSEPAANRQRTGSEDFCEACEPTKTSKQHLCGWMTLQKLGAVGYRLSLCLFWISWLSFFNHITTDVTWNCLMLQRLNLANTSFTMFGVARKVEEPKNYPYWKRSFELFVLEKALR